MRRLGLWPNAGGINGTSAIKVPQLNFLDWFNSGWHHIFQYWTIAVNTLVTLFVALVLLQCSIKGVKKSIPFKPEELNRLYMMDADTIESEYPPGEHTWENTPFSLPVIQIDLYNPEKFFSKDSSPFTTQVLLDTGASHSLIPYIVAKELQCVITPTDVRPRSISNHVVELEGETRLLVRIGEAIFLKHF